MKKLFLLLLLLANLGYSQDEISHKKTLVLQAHLIHIDNLLEKNKEAIDSDDYHLMSFYLSICRVIANDLQEAN